jgi:hypothetical protein
MASYFACPAEGPKLGADRDAVNLIGDALGRGAGMIVIPAERLAPDFFRLRTGVAGAFLQKFVTYDRRVAIVGDISRHVEESSALGDFVRESNRGDHVWFVANIEELEVRVARSQQFSSD